MTTAVQTAVVTPPATQEDFVLGVFLSSGFRIHADGWLYPQGDNPLVRVRTHAGQYTMERRRTPEGAWMRIVTASVREFDQDAFEQWAENWPLLAA